MSIKQGRLWHERRSFAHVLGATAVAAAMPRLTLAQAPKPIGIARLNANENPYGPAHAHDLSRMLQAAKGEGLIYVCNPKPNVREAGCGSM